MYENESFSCFGNMENCVVITNALAFSEDVMRLAEAWVDIREEEDRGLLVKRHSFGRLH